MHWNSTEMGIPDLMAEASQHGANLTQLILEIVNGGG
jgi:hypothetical protein